jgi:hypothetical protein
MRVAGATGVGVGVRPSVGTSNRARLDGGQNKPPGGRERNRPGDQGSRGLLRAHKAPRKGSEITSANGVAKITALTNATKSMTYLAILFQNMS